jgi:hypothetical protein
MKNIYNSQDIKKVRILKYILFCADKLALCKLESNNLNGYYFRKQIEVAKRKFFTFNS